MGRDWLTPNTPPAHKFFSRTLQIPATSEFLGLVNGALIELAQAHNWEVSGDMTEQETADYFLAMLQPFWHNDNPPPDWETAEDVDGTPEQPWYDDLADWVIAGFLAITFTPQAAIVYQATVPKLRIAIRTGNLGALFKVLINGIEVWSGDSYSPITDLIDHVFDMSAETEPYTVRIEHNGIGENIEGPEAKLEVIRGEAVASMVATILRADPEGCGIQWSQNDGDTWTTIDLATCITGLANDAIINAINGGVIATPGSQPGPGAPPGPGECTTYHVVLRANDRWLCPSPVSSGNTVRVTNLAGGWSDGTLAWYCPDGARYLSGACSETLHTHEEGDPLNPDAYHMAVIASVNDEDFGDPITTQYTIPSGHSADPLILMANDGTLGDNQGEITFDVEICDSLQLEWYHEWDFRTQQAEWTIEHGLWNEEVGFYGSNWSGHNSFRVKKGWANGCTVTYLKMGGNWVKGSSQPYDALDVGNDGGSAYMSEPASTMPDGPYFKEYTVDVQTATCCTIQSLACYNCTDGDCSMWLFGIGGTGTDPFA